jgi:hypothetical protein
LASKWSLNTLEKIKRRVKEREMGTEGFNRFWNAWPKSVRKGGKSDCEKRWNRYYCDSCVDQIIKHIEWMKTTDDWRKADGAFIPAPAVYLNQRRWDGAEIPEIKKPVDVLKQIEESRKAAVPMPDDIRQKLNALRGK